MKLKRILLVFGAVCLAGAVGLTGYNLVSSDRAGYRADSVAEALIPLVPTVENAPNVVAPAPDLPTHPEREMPTVSLDGTRYAGYLEIPRLNVTLPVASSFSMKQLISTPAVYTGSVYRGDMVIAAHNYNSHFGRLNQLGVGDEIRFVGADGTVHSYTVGWSEQISPSDREAMVTASGWDLTLFTCTYNGKQRFALRCIAT